MATEKGIQKQLAALVEERDKLHDLALEEETAVGKILTPEIRDRVDTVRKKYASVRQATQIQIDALEASIKRDTVALGHSVRGARWQAVWAKPRISWNTAGLEGFGAAHPEILQFRSEGKPTVSLRAVAQEKDEDPQ